MAVLLVAVLECHDLWNNQLKKLRLVQEDIARLVASSSSSHHHHNKEGDGGGVNTSNEDTICTGTCLNYGILELVKMEFGRIHNLSETDEFWDSIANNNARVEIYCSTRNKFISLMDDKIQHCDIIQEFGSRIRCTILGIPTTIISSEQEKGTTESLAIMGRFFHYDPTGMDFMNKTLVVKEVPNNQVDGTGLNVWDGALLLARYLEAQPSKVASKSVLELGSGTGFVGIAAAMVGAKEVILTDLEYTVQLMIENVQLNHETIFTCTNNVTCERIECMECDWFSPPPLDQFGFITSLKDAIGESSYPEIILVADCIWVEDLVIPLMNTLERYSHQGSRVIITYQKRGKNAHDVFLSRLHDLFRNVIAVDSSKFGLSKPDTIFLFECFNAL